MTDSVTELLNSMRDGEEKATNDLLKHFLPRLRSKLAKTARGLRISDEDDIAISAFYELCVAIQNSRFEDISDRTQLWRVLSMIAVRKARDFKKSESAERRGGKESVVSLSGDTQDVPSMEQRPELNVQLLEQCENFLQNLGDSNLQKVAQLKLQGLTNQEIANELGISRRSMQYMMVKVKQEMLVALS